jgi:S1-C subfamily serine protease
MDEITETHTPEPAAAATPPPRSRFLGKGAITGIAIASVLSLGAVTGGLFSAATLVSAIAEQRQTTTTTETVTPDQSQGTQGTEIPQYGGDQQQYGTYPQSPSTGTGTDDTSSAQTDATDAQSTGIVLINTELGYESGEAAGTGIVLTSDGEILTNNHVIEGSTKITVTIASTGKTYSATVVGNDPTNDVAVIQLENASGLEVADLDTTDSVAIGDEVTGVGNSEGQGYLSAAAGTVTALDQEITVSDELTSAGKQLDGLIETDAPIVSGDSGGPLLDSDGEVIGIDTAASSNTQNPTGYAIPISDALEIVDQIESGVESDTVNIGYPAFLGVQLGTTTTTAGVAIGGVIEDTPAADAGLAAGDTITAFDGLAVTTSTALSAAVAAHDPGDTAKITWTDASGESHTATVTLVEGPAA